MALGRTLRRRDKVAAFILMYAFDQLLYMYGAIFDFYTRWLLQTDTGEFFCDFNPILVIFCNLRPTVRTKFHPHGGQTHNPDKFWTQLGVFCPDKNSPNRGFLGLTSIPIAGGPLGTS